MKAVTIKSFGNPEQMTIEEVDPPIPGAREILVEVEATALNRADLLQRQGKYPPPEGESDIMGLEMAGVVKKVGVEVKKWKVGDAVCGLLPGGGYAQLAKIHEDMALPLPKGFSMEEAAAVPEVFLTAFQALSWLGGLEKGETVLIHAGASGVGTAAIQMARVMGARPIITASKNKHAFCLDLGAAHAIDYKNQDFEAEINKITHKRGAHLIVDFIGAPYFQKNLNALASDGRLVMLGFLGGARLPEVNLAPVLRKRLQIQGSTLRSRSLDYKIRLSKDMCDFAWPLLENRQLKPIIDKVFSWEKVVEAHRYMEANKNVGKIVLKLE